jgi:hypothetical protein
VHPLPNLEYRTVCADSLRDFVAGVEVQQTRAGALTLGFDIDDPDRLVALREQYFEAFDPEAKAGLRHELEEAEDALVERIFARALERAREAVQARSRDAREQGAAALEEQIPDLQRQFRSPDRVFPAFLPAFHAPDVAREGGWDVAIMNPPYVGRKEVAQRFDASYRADLESHYGRTYDLMIHFGFRAFELARPGGIVSMIFNDSIFTSVDATDFRRALLPDGDSRIRVAAIARTRCFEGKAVNGGVIVAVEEVPSERPIRYIENHGRAPDELTGASIAAKPADSPVEVGRSELWIANQRDYRRLPHRPLFRPSPEALAMIDRFEDCAGWSEFRRMSVEGHGADWAMLSETSALQAWTEEQRRTGFYERLHDKRFVLLGLVIEGGVGLQSGEDRRFLAAIEGTAAAVDAERRKEAFERLVLERPEPAEIYRSSRKANGSVEQALLDVSEHFRDSELGWPRVGLIRTIAPGEVLQRRLTKQEVERGIVGGPSFVPFEKGDDSDEGGGSRWRRDNPLAIDWSVDAVTLLRARASQSVSYRKPYFRNEKLWGRGESRGTGSPHTFECD